MKTDELRWVRVTVANVGRLLPELAKMFVGVAEGYEHEASVNDLLAKEVMFIGQARDNHICMMLMDEEESKAFGIATGDLYTDPAGKPGIRLHWTYSKVRDGRDRLYDLIREFGLAHVTIETARPEAVMMRYDPELTEVARIYRREL